MVEQLRAGNSILQTMDDADFALLAPAMKRVDMAKGEEFTTPDEPLAFSWFPLAGMVSVVATTPDGDQAEVGVVGREGMFALSTVHGIDWEAMRIFVQLPGSALRLRASALRAAMDASPGLKAHMLAYAQSFTLQIAGAALAYATRTIEERLARWLLMCLDRLDGPDVSLTHESLALMLGVRRAGVTVAVQGLENRGAIAARRATITVVDRSILEAIAGDSYGSAERRYARLMSTPLVTVAPINNGHAPQA